MVSLLDINVLVALFDPTHCHHEVAHQWYRTNKGHGWATCPLTENGFVRIVSNTAYPGNRTLVADAVKKLQRFQASGHHSFWADSTTLLDDSIFDLRHMRGHQQITDVYLLALAVINQGRLATFDRTIEIRAVRNATSAHIVSVNS